MCCHHPFVVHSNLLDQLYANPYSHEERNPSKSKENRGYDGESAGSRHVECLGFHNLHSGGLNGLEMGRSKVPGPGDLPFVYFAYTMWNHLVKRAGYGIVPVKDRRLHGVLANIALTTAPWGMKSHGQHMAGRRRNFYPTSSRLTKSQSVGSCICYKMKRETG